MGHEVLLVDDERHILQVLSVTLRQAGFEVRTALNADEAAALCARRQPDAIITDHRMPGPSGLEFCRNVRSWAEGRTLPLLLLTGVGYELTREEVRQAGVDCMIHKPFSPRELTRSLRSLIEQRATDAA